MLFDDDAREVSTVNVPKRQVTLEVKAPDIVTTVPPSSVPDSWLMPVAVAPTVTLRPEVAPVSNEVEVDPGRMCCVGM